MQKNIRLKKSKQKKNLNLAACHTKIVLFSSKCLLENALQNLVTAGIW